MANKLVYDLETKEGKIVNIPDPTEEEILEIKIKRLRRIREVECFPIVNRGTVWYDTLTEEQKLELTQWYNAWLQVTETLEEPTKPMWLQ